jgi:hypothetical protein
MFITYQGKEYVRNVKSCKVDSVCATHILNNVTVIPIARQRFSKHISAEKKRATIGCPLLGNGSVNTSP